MITFKEIGFLLFIISSFILTEAQQEQQIQNFHDFDRGNDFTSSFNDNDEHFDIRHNIPGEPEVDYPVYSNAPRTGFNCDNRHEGYYADIKARCQVFRICSHTDLTGEGFPFLCPNGTIFSQKNFICDWYENVDCSESENFYSLNERLGKAVSDEDGMLEEVKKIVDHPIKSATRALHNKPITIPRRNLNQLLPSSSSSNKDKLNINKENSSQSVNQRSRFGLDNPPRKQSERNNVPDFDDEVLFQQQNEPFPPITTLRPTTFINILQNDDERRTTRKRIKTTRIPVAKDEIEPTDLNKIVPSGEIYVSNLGQLSTDVGSNFDPKTSLIITENDLLTRSTLTTRDVGKDSSFRSKNQERLALKRNDSSAFKGSSRRATNLLRSSFLVNSDDNPSFDSSSKTSRSSARLTTASRDHVELKTSQRRPSEVKLSNPSSIPTHRNHPRSLAEKINEALSNDVQVTAAEESGIFGKTMFSGEENFLLDFPTSRQYLNFAANINSAFDITENYPSSASASSESESVEYPTHQAGYAPPSPFRNSYPKGNALAGRTNRQFQFIGSAFMVPGQANTSPFAPRLNNNSPQSRRYLPPIGQGFTKAPQTSSQSGIPRQPLKAHSTSQTIINNNKPGNVPSLLIDINDINAAEDVEPATGDDDVHVKRKAENLLLQGVHLTLYENGRDNLVDDNSINEFSSGKYSTTEQSRISTTAVPTKDKTRHESRLSGHRVPTHVSRKQTITTTTKQPFTIFIVPSVEHTTKKTIQKIPIEALNRPTVKTYVYSAEYSPNLKEIAPTGIPTIEIHPSTTKLPLTTPSPSSSSSSSTADTTKSLPPSSSTILLHSSSSSTFSSLVSTTPLPTTISSSTTLSLSSFASSGIRLNNLTSSSSISTTTNRPITTRRQTILRRVSPARIATSKSTSVSTQTLRTTKTPISTVKPFVTSTSNTTKPLFIIRQQAPTTTKAFSTTKQPFITRQNVHGRQPHVVRTPFPVISRTTVQTTTPSTSTSSLQQETSHSTRKSITNPPTRNTRRRTTSSARTISTSRKPFSSTYGYQKVTTRIPPTSSGLTSTTLNYRKRTTVRRISTNHISNSNNNSKFQQTYNLTYLEEPTDNGLTDLTPNAASDGVRSLFNRIRNETNKYAHIARQQSIFHSDKKHVHDRKPKTTKLPLSPTSLPLTFSNINLTLPVRTIYRNRENENKTESTFQINRYNPQRSQRLQASNHPNGGQSAQQQQQIISDTKKAASSYVPLPGTKVTIAKSQEQAHFAISNDPNLNRNETHNNVQNSYILLDQYLSNQFTGNQQHNPSQSGQQQSSGATSNYFLPFPTVAPKHIKRKESDYPLNFEPFPNLNPSIENHLNGGEGRYNGGSPNEGASIDPITFEPFPPLSNAPAQRRSDSLTRENKRREKALYEGPSSYNVPLNSVGRLPADIVANRRRRQS